MMAQPRTAFDWGRGLKKELGILASILQDCTALDLVRNFLHASLEMLTRIIPMPFPRRPAVASGVPPRSGSSQSELSWRVHCIS